MQALPLLHSVHLKDEAQLHRCGFFLAQCAHAGDFLALNGPLGVGKTSLARALISAKWGTAEPIPSPSFSLVQTYKTSDLHIVHGDLYRIKYESELAELELFDESALVLLEWASRAQRFLPSRMLRLDLRFGRTTQARHLRLYGDKNWRRRLRHLPRAIKRADALGRFLHVSGYGRCVPVPIAGDASARRYERLSPPSPAPRAQAGATAIVMDWHYKTTPKARLRYERHARLASAPRAFIAIAQHLTAQGIAAPTMLEADVKAGFLLMEDLGTSGLTKAHHEQAAYVRLAYLEAIELLLTLSDDPAPANLSLAFGQHKPYTLPKFDADTLRYELDVFMEFYLPFVGKNLSRRAQRQWQTCWDALAPAMTDGQQVLVLRDFHSPNLLWRANLQTRHRLGVIDIQDGVLGPPAYDVVSLLQDARVTIATRDERFWLRHYMRQRHIRTRDWNRQAFLRSYAALGAQRACRIAGTFVRLAQQDNKPRYLAHLPRVLSYLRRNLAHADLAQLRGWFAQYIPPMIQD